MKLFFAIAALVAFASAHWVPSNATHFHDQHSGKTIQHFGCGAHSGNAHPSYLDAIKKLHNNKRSGAGSRAAALVKKQVPNPMTVNTYFHVIESTANTGTITPDMVTAQLTALNTAYNPIGVSFNLANTDFTVNDAWAVAAGTDMDAAKAALRQGTYSDLNLYFHTDLADGNLGTCTLPAAVPAGADTSLYVSDGCDVNANTMPGGTMEGYNLGGTAVHETGHWLGLLHTFEGYTCDMTTPGDYIDDTPFESQSTNGCPDKPPKDSCPTDTGVDPIHNYMDYSTDACYEAFTPGQVARIATLWTQFRAGT